MSRSISQIYAEAVLKRNNYLQLTELNNGQTNNNNKNKLSVMNVLTYVFACLIYTYENILAVFEMDVATILSERIAGPTSYYLTMAKKFQFVSSNSTDSRNIVVFNEDTLRMEYQTVDEDVRIISKVAYDMSTDGRAMTLKVCKDNDDANTSSGETPYQPLDDDELTAFKSYISQIQFVGATVDTISIPGDIMTVECNIVYDKRYITAEQAFTNVQTALIDYVTNLEYNTYIYYQSIIDAIQKADYILNIPIKDSEGNSCIRIGFQYWDTTDKTYKNYNFGTEDTPDYYLSDRYKPVSGYLSLVKDNETTIVYTETESGSGIYFEGMNPMATE